MSTLGEQVSDLREEVTGLGSSLPPTRRETDAVRTFLREASGEVKTLLRQELDLAKAEVGEQAGKAGKGAGMFAGAALAALMMVIFASIAAWWGLAHLVDTAWAALIVTAVWAVIAAVLAVLGRGVLKSMSVTPQRTLDSIKRIPSVFTPARGETP